MDPIDWQSDRADVSKRSEFASLDIALAAYQAALREHAAVEEDLIRAKAEAWMRGQASSVTAREKETELATVDLRAELVRLRADLEAARAAFETERAKLGA